MGNSKKSARMSGGESEENPRKSRCAASTPNATINSANSNNHSSSSSSESSTTASQARQKKQLRFCDHKGVSSLFTVSLVLCAAWLMVQRYTGNRDLIPMLRSNYMKPPPPVKITTGINVGNINPNMDSNFEDILTKSELMVPSLGSIEDIQNARLRSSENQDGSVQIISTGSLATSSIGTKTDWSRTKGSLDLQLPEDTETQAPLDLGKSPAIGAPTLPPVSIADLVPRIEGIPSGTVSFVSSLFGKPNQQPAPTAIPVEPEIQNQRTDSEQAQQLVSNQPPTSQIGSVSHQVPTQQGIPNFQQAPVEQSVDFQQPSSNAQQSQVNPVAGTPGQQEAPASPYVAQQGFNHMSQQATNGQYQNPTNGMMPNQGQAPPLGPSSATDLSFSVECFQTKRSERVCVASPFCVEVNADRTMTPLLFMDGFVNGTFPTRDIVSSPLKCFRIQSEGVLSKISKYEDCENALAAMFKETDFQRQVKIDSSAAFHESLRESRTVMLGGSNWAPTDSINGAFIFGNLASKANKNIAHYAGRIMFPFHILANPTVYKLAGAESLDIASKPLNAILIGSASAYLFNEGWHGAITRAILYPLQFSTQQIVFRSWPDVVKGMPFLLNPLPAMASGGVFAVPSPPPGLRLCMSKAVITAFLKGRYFVDPKEFVPEAALRQMGGMNPDLVRFKANIARAMFPVNGIPPMKAKLVYLSRNGTNRRAFDPPSEQKLVNLLEGICREGNFQFESVHFDTMQLAKEQISKVFDVAVAVGIHGANLVNTMFLPAQAFLIEIFPFGFTHGMYVNSTGATPFYSSLTLESDPGPARDLSSYKNVAECVHKSATCKVHYRGDYRVIPLTDNDLTRLGQAVRDAIEAVKPKVHNR